MLPEKQDADEKVPFSAAEIIDSDSEVTVKNYAESVSLYPCACNANIYNAFIICNYRKDLQFKEHTFISRDLRYGLGFLAYLTAAIQWIALTTMIAAFIDKADKTKTNSADAWTYLPSDWRMAFIWPFFVIGLFSTYKQLAQIWVDIKILAEWHIHATHCHVLFLKYFSELILYTFGSFLFYVTLSFYVRSVDYLDVILKLLAYQYIFMADECAYLLVKDIVRRRIKPEYCSSFFQGTRNGEITRYEMMIAITIPLSISFMIQGIFARTLSTLGIGILSTMLWTLDYWNRKCSKKSVIYY